MLSALAQALLIPIIIVGKMPKRKAEQLARQSKSFSPAAYKLLESWAWGDMSAAALQELARAIVMTFGHGVEDVADLARLGAHGNSSANCQRDLFRLPQLANLKVPEPYLVDADVITYQAGSAQLVQTTIPVLRPFDWVQTLHKHGLTDLVLGSATNVKSFWSKVKATDPKLYNNPVKDVPAWKERCIRFMCMVMLGHTKKRQHQCAQHDVTGCTTYGGGLQHAAFVCYT